MKEKDVQASPEVIEADATLFDERLKRGEQMRDKIAEASDADPERFIIPEYDALHTKQKLLLSLFDAGSVTLARDDRHQVSPRGLNIDGKTYDYTPEYREELHQEYVDKIIGNASSPEEIAKKLTAENDGIIDLFEKDARNDIIKRESALFARKVETLREKYWQNNQHVSIESVYGHHIRDLKPEITKSDAITIGNKIKLHKSKAQKQDSFTIQNINARENAILKLPEKEKAVEDTKAVLEEKRELFEAAEKAHLDAAKELRKAKNRLNELKDEKKKNDDRLDSFNSLFAKPIYDELKQRTLKEIADITGVEPNDNRAGIDFNRVDKGIKDKDDVLFTIAQAYKEQKDIISQTDYYGEKKRRGGTEYAKEGLSKLAKQYMDGDTEKSVAAISQKIDDMEYYNEYQRELDEKEIAELNKQLPTLDVANKTLLKGDINASIAYKDAKAEYEKAIQDVAMAQSTKERSKENFNKRFRDLEKESRECRLIDELSRQFGIRPISAQMSQIINGIKEDKFSESSQYYEIGKKYHQDVMKINNIDYYERYRSDDIQQTRATATGALDELRDSVFYDELRTKYNFSQDEFDKIIAIDAKAELDERKTEFVIKHSGLSAEEIEHYEKEGNYTGGDISKQLISKYRAIHGAPPQGVISRLEHAAYMLHYTTVKDEEQYIGDRDFKAPLEVKQSVHQHIIKTDTHVLLHHIDRGLEEKEKSRYSDKAFKILNEYSIEKSRHTAIDALAPKDNNERRECEDFVKDIESEIRRRLEVRAKVVDAAVNFGDKLSIDDSKKQSEEIEQLESQKPSIINAAIRRDLEKYKEKCLSNFTTSLFGKKAQKVYILPTGFVVQDKNDQFFPIAANIFSDEVADEIPDKYQNIWSAITKQLDEGNERSSMRIAKIINSDIERDFTDNIDYVPSHEKQIHDYCEQNHIEQPDTIRERNGKILEQLAPDDIETVTYCLENYGRYINDIDTTTQSRLDIDKPSVDDTVKRFLLGGNRPSIGIYMASPDGKNTLMVKNFADYVKLLGNEAADTALIESISMGVYAKNSTKLSPILEKVLGQKCNISLVDVKRLTGEKVLRYEARKEIAKRAYFVASYNRFLRGEKIPDPKLAELVKRVDALEFGQKQ